MTPNENLLNISGTVSLSELRLIGKLNKRKEPQVHIKHNFMSSLTFLNETLINMLLGKTFRLFLTTHSTIPSKHFFHQLHF